MLAWLINRLQGRVAVLSGASSTDARQLAAIEVSVEDLKRADYLFQQGNKARQSGQIEQAERLYRQALNVHPQNAMTCANLGALLRDKGNVSAADAFLTRAVELMPTLAPASFNLALLRIDQTRWRDASVLLRQSLAANPRQSDANYWLGNVLMDLGDAVGARKAYQAAIRLDSNYMQPRWGLVVSQLPAIPGSNLEQVQALEQFSREFGKLRNWLRGHRAFDVYEAVGAQQPYYMAYIEGNHKERLAEYGKVCVNLMATGARKVGLSAPPIRRTGNRLRVGVVSAHVRSHSVWYALVRGWVEHLNAGTFEIHIFHTGLLRDSETEWAARKATTFHTHIGTWPQWAKCILDNHLDVLIYPELGMDSTTFRLSALRLARVQLAAWGHPVTTGLSTIDGYISAQSIEPANGADHYTEKLYALPGLGSCYQPYGTRPTSVNFEAWGIEALDKVLLCPGAAFKYAPKHDAVWVEIARHCQPCKLVFFRSDSDDLASMLERRLRAAFTAEGLEFDRVVRFVPWQPRASFFAFLDRANVFLDTLGFSGFNTAMQAVERATPIVAFEGECLRGRFASAILQQMDMHDDVARSTDQYIKIASRLVHDNTARERTRQAAFRHRAQLYDNRASIDALGGVLLQLAQSAE